MNETKSDKRDKNKHFSCVETPQERPCGVVSQEVARVERDSTRHAKERFVAIYERIGGMSITGTAQRVEISRSTFYRWMEEDQSFKNKVEQIRMLIDDLVQDMLFMKIAQGDGPSIRFYLSRRHPEYSNSNKGIYTIPNPYGIHSLEDLFDKLKEDSLVA